MRNLPIRRRVGVDGVFEALAGGVAESLDITADFFSQPLLSGLKTQVQSSSDSLLIKTNRLAKSLEFFICNVHFKLPKYSVVDV